MKQKKYSESKIKTAQKFLSNYDLSFDALDEPQKKAVINYTHSQKYVMLCLAVFTFSLVISIVGAWLYYNRAHATINQISEMSPPTKAIDLRIYGESCFGRGVNFGASSIGALMMLLYIIFLPILLRGKLQILKAFLPSLEHFSDNEKISDN